MTEKQRREKIGQALAEARNRLGLSTRDVPKLVSSVPDNSTITKLEKGNMKSIDFFMLEDLARVYRIPITRFLTQKAPRRAKTVPAITALGRTGEILVAKHKEKDPKKWRVFGLNSGEIVAVGRRAKTMIRRGVLVPAGTKGTKNLQVYKTP